MSDMYVGQVFIISWPWVPAGAASCDGSTPSIQQYTALYSLVGTIYGGDGRSTFGLPDLRNRFLMGTQFPTAPYLGQKAGAASAIVSGQIASGSVQLATANLPAHTHPLTGNVSVATTVATYGALANQPKPGGNLLAKAQEAVSSAVVNTYTNSATDGTALGGVSSAVTNTMAVGATGTGTPVSLNIPVTPVQIATVPPYIELNYVIALNGLYPPRP